MNNKFSEIYLEKNKEIFESFDSKKLIENFGNDYTKRGPYDGSWQWGGPCPKEYPFGTYHNFEVTRDNESRTKCDSQCERNYSYREYEKHTGGYRCIQHWSGSGRYAQAPYNEPTNTLHSVYFLDPDSTKDKNFLWKNEIEKCKPGEGNCPQDCEYEYSKCDDNCKKYLTIHKESKNSGKKCPEKVRDCVEGVECPFKPIDCEEGYGACKILDDIDVPSNLIGKCGKKNVIYKNSNHGGKSCVNSKYKACNDGEGECPKDCDGNWTECNEDCRSIFIKSINESNGGKCPPENKPKPECKPGMGKCAANIDCEGEWSECTSYPDCERVYSHKVKQSGKGINCRYRDGFTQKCDSCEAPAPPPKEPGVIDDKESEPVNDSTPQTPPPVINLPEEIPPVKIPPNITPVPPSKPKPNPSIDSEEKTEQKDENKEEPISETSMLSNENTLIIIYMMGAIILLLFIFIVIYEPKEIVLNIE